MHAQEATVLREAPLLTLRGIGKSFPGVRALCGVNLDINAGEIHALLGENGAGKSTRIKILSGGNQQKVVLARWLNHHAKILFFDEPTRGIDIGAKSEIYLLMRPLTERGHSIVMVSSKLPEIIGMRDRVAVFCEGRIVRILEGDDINPAEMMRHATAGGSHELH